MKIILGSSSKYRGTALKNNGYEFEVMNPDIDEKSIRTDDYYQLPLAIAKAKAFALFPHISEPALLITGDQVIVCNKELHEKPESEKEAKYFLKKYSDGHCAETVSALVVINTKNGKQAEGIDIGKICFKPIPNKVIEDYLKNGNPYARAGGFAIESPILKPYLETVEGTMESMMGMPITLLKKLIKEVED